MFHCHCRDCQRATGAPYSSVIGMPGAAVKLLQGTPRWYSTPSMAGGLLDRGFCADCGSPIISLLAGMPFTAIKVGSLDDPNQFHPSASIFVASAPAWAPHFAGVPTFPRNPG